MRLISAIYNRPVTVGALISKQSVYIVPLLEAAARLHGLKLELLAVDPGPNLTRSLNRLSAAQLVLIFPDAALYTAQSLRELLESTYRRRLPVIGFSAALVAAGTLASAISEGNEVAAQIESILDLSTVGRWPDPQYPRYWRVALNESVARSLDIVVDDRVRSIGEQPR